MSSDQTYQTAKRQVRKIKGFYIHLQVYLTVLVFLTLLPYLVHEGEEDFSAIWGLGFWGIGLLAHGCSVFIPKFILGRKWEERKIEELIRKEKAKKNAT
ncbi:2TM domain-containing protein [Chryseobacterium sp. A301]